MRDRRIGLGSVLVTFAVVASCTGSGEGSPTTSGEGSPTTSERREPRPIVMEDFESGTLTDWRAASGGSGGWFVYADGQTAPDPAQSDPNVPFDLPDPPQGKLAAVTDMNGPGTRILYRDLTLDGRFTVHLTVFYASSAPFPARRPWPIDGSEPNQQFRIDLVDPSAPIDSRGGGRCAGQRVPHVARRPEPPRADRGQRRRLALGGRDGTAPLGRNRQSRVRCVSAWTTSASSRSAPISDGRVEFPVTAGGVDRDRSRPAPNERSRGGGGAVGPRRGAAPATDEFSGAVLVARNGEVLLEDAWGLADRKAGTPNTTDTKFRIGSMNKMFTAVATLQLVEAGKLALDDPIGKHLPDYPNQDVASQVTVRHLLTHSGGTGDIFGPEFERNRLTLREHRDYVDLYGSRAPEFEPGSRFEYSNYGFVLLGALIEAVSGESYYDYVRSNVFQPAGMTSTDSLPETDNVPNRAIGYMRAGDGWEPNTDTLPWRGTAAGGGYSTVGDLLRFAQALSSGTPDLEGDARRRRPARTSRATDTASPSGRTPRRTTATAAGHPA